MKVITGMIVASAICLCQVCCGGQVATLGQGSSSQSKKAEPNSTDPRQEQLSGEAHFYRANGLNYGAGKPEAALKEYNLAIENGYDTNELRMEMGRLLARQLHRPEEAIEQFRIVIQRDETEWRAHWPLAKLLLETKQYDEALKELEISKQLDSEGNSNGFYAYYTALALDALGRYDEALKDYEAFLERAKKIEPNSSRADEVKARVEAIKEKLNLN